MKEDEARRVAEESDLRTVMYVASQYADRFYDYRRRACHETNYDLEVFRAALEKQVREAIAAAIVKLTQGQEPAMIYHGRHTIDCGEFGSHDMEMLKLIPAGTKLYPNPIPSQQEAPPSGFCWDEDDLCFRTSFGLLWTKEFHDTWFARRSEFVTFKERKNTGTIDPVKAPRQQEERVAELEREKDDMLKDRVALAMRVEELERVLEALRGMDGLDSDHCAAIDAALSKEQGK